MDAAFFYSNSPFRLPPLFPFYKTPARYQPLPAPGTAFNIATLVVKGPTDDMANRAPLILIVIKRFSWKREAILVFDVVLDAGGGSWVFYILAAVFADSHRFPNRNSCRHLQRCFVPKKKYHRFMLRVKENPQALGYLLYNLKRCFLPKRPSFLRDPHFRSLISARKSVFLFSSSCRSKSSPLTGTSMADIFLGPGILVTSSKFMTGLAAPPLF